MAEIAIEGADHLYREIRIENALEDDKGKPVKLKPGAQWKSPWKPTPRKLRQSSAATLPDFQPEDGFRSW